MDPFRRQQLSSFVKPDLECQSSSQHYLPLIGTQAVWSPNIESGSLPMQSLQASSSQLSLHQQTNMQQYGFQTPQWSKVLQSSYQENCTSPPKSGLNPFADEFIPASARSSNTKQMNFTSEESYDDSIPTTSKASQLSALQSRVKAGGEMVTYGRYSLPSKFVNGAMQKICETQMEEKRNDGLFKSSLWRSSCAQISNFYKSPSETLATQQDNSKKPFKTVFFPLPTSGKSVIPIQKEVADKSDDKEIFGIPEDCCKINKDFKPTMHSSTVCPKSTEGLVLGNIKQSSLDVDSVVFYETSYDVDDHLSTITEDCLQEPDGGILGEISGKTGITRQADVCCYCNQCISSKQLRDVSTSTETPLTRDVGTSMALDKNTREVACNTYLTAISAPKQIQNPHQMNRFLKDAEMLSSLTFSELYNRLVDEPITPTGKRINPLLQTLLDLIQEHREDIQSLGEINQDLSQLAEYPPLLESQGDVDERPKTRSYEVNEKRTEDSAECIALQDAHGFQERQSSQSATSTSLDCMRFNNDVAIPDSSVNISRTLASEVQFSDLNTFKQYMLVEARKHQDASTNTAFTLITTRSSTMRIFKTLPNDQGTSVTRRSAFVATNKLTEARKQYSNATSSSDTSSEQKPKRISTTTIANAAKKTKKDVPFAVKVIPEKDFEEKARPSTRNTSIAKRVTRSITNFRMLMCKTKADAKDKNSNACTVAENKQNSKGANRTSSTLPTPPDSSKAGRAMSKSAKKDCEDKLMKPSTSSKNSDKSSEKKSLKANNIPKVELIPDSESSSGNSSQELELISNIQTLKKSSTPACQVDANKAKPKTATLTNRNTNTNSFRLRRSVAEQRIFLDGRIRDDYLFK